MTKARLSSIMQKAFEDTPGSPLVIIGLGALMLSLEATRLSTIQSVKVDSLFIITPTGISLIVFLLALILYLRNPKFRLHRVPAVGISIATIMSLCMLTMFEQSVWLVHPLVATITVVVYNVMGGLLLLLWTETLISYGAKRVSMLLAISMFVLTVLSFLVAFLKIDAARSITAFLPVLSVGCLYFFKEYNYSRRGLEPDDTRRHSLYYQFDTSLFVPKDSKHGYRSFSLLTLTLSLFCYALAFGQVHYSWIPFQDGATNSLLIQLAAAVGTIVGGCVVLVLVGYFWSRYSVELCRLLVLPILIFALYLSSSTTESWMFFYIVLLNIVHKLAFLFIALAPFTIKSKEPHILPWCMAFLAYTAGKASSSTLLSVLSMETYITIVIFSLVILTICGIASAFVGSLNNGIMDNDSDTTTAYAEFERYEKNHLQKSSEDLRNHKIHAVCSELSIRYQLTRREGEILLLLARGRTAQHIAEILVITTSTAKTHMRNIYAKMNIHTQQELLNLVEEVIDQRKGK